MGTIVLADVTELTTVKLSELPSALSADTGNILPIVKDATTQKIEKGNFGKDLRVDLANVIHVAKNGNDSNTGTIGDPFLTIQAAIDSAIANLPAAPAIVSIIVYPGTYEEQITNIDSRIYISGSTFAPQCIEAYCTLEHPAILYNTGVDAAHYPFAYTGASVLNLSNMTIKVEDGNVFGEFSNIMFDKCYFKGGHFVEYLGSGGKALEFINCVCYCDMFDLSGTVGDRFIYFHATYLFGTGAMNFGSTGGVYSKNIRLTLTIISNNVLIGGSWSLEAYIFNMIYDGILRFDTTGNVVMDIAEQRNGIHFISNPLGIKSMSNINFSNPQIASDHRDISADVIITDVIYMGNIQQNGISGNIQITNPEKRVGASSRDSYFDLQSAITSIPASTKGIIKIFESLSDLAELTLTANQDITIEGSKTYSLSFAADIVNLVANESLVFYGLANITGGNIEVNGNSAYVGFEECLTVSAYVTLTSGTGTYCLVYSSTIKAPTGHPAITQNNLTSTIVSGYSRLDGGVGHPAILTTVEADSGIKAKFSTLIHGDGAGNAPLIYTGANKMDILVYACALNAAWNAAHYTNLIGSPNNTISSEINF